MIDRARLVAPRSHLAVLVEPDGAQLAGAAASYSGDSQFTAERILDSSLDGLRRALRRRLGVPQRGPVFVTGHQAEFYHAGVLAKTIAADELAKRSRGAAVYITVDYDTSKTTRLAVPQQTPSGPRRIEVAVPGCDLRVPVVFQPRVTRGHWLDFFARVASTTINYESSLLRPFVDAWCGAGPAGEPLDFADAISRGQRACEALLGVSAVLELRGATLCDTPEFRAFVAHIALRAEEFARHYNAAQDAYRARNGVRNRSVPAPHLMIGTERVELPFWLLRADEPRRRLSVSRTEDGAIAILADDRPVARFSASEFRSAAFHERAWELAPPGWLIRPRALTLSGFARLFLADLFIHGIGGAKYDEMTDAFCRAFFGTAPAPTACVTATALADLPRSAVASAEWNAARRRTRDVRYNPQRYVRSAPAELLARREALIRENAQLRATAPADRPARRRVYDELRRANEGILANDPWRPAQLADDEAALAARLELDRVASDREYFFALLSGDTMQALQQRIRTEFST